MLHPKTPIIVGISQFVQRFQTGIDLLEPIKMAEKCIREAIDDAKGENILNHIDAMYVVNIFGYQYEDAPKTLSENLHINPKIKFYSAYGGNTPQYLVNKAADLLTKGNINFAIITGAEANYSLGKALKNNIKLNWTPQKSPRATDDENKMGTSILENDYELFLLSTAYPIIETALRAENKNNIDTQQKIIGQIYEKFAKTAAQNPFAWTQTPYTKEEIQTIADENRTIAFPYLKRMCANNQTDHSAALLLTTVENAQKHNIPQEKWVFLSAAADLNDAWFFTQRKNIAESIAIKKATEICLKHAEIPLKNIDAFDLYSCFPAAVQVAQKSIGLSLDDKRPLSLTGGLSFFGGPWNNYSMHAIATTIEKIRNNIFKNVLINGLGWYITKHSIGIYSKFPPKGIFELPNLDDLQKEIDAEMLPDLVKEANGKATIIGYSILFDFKNQPNKTIFLLELENKLRALSYWQASSEEMKYGMENELVGKKVEVFFDVSKKRNFVSQIF
ncbi:MAG: hypothetical protein EAZ85_01960 [Bacteroidetes bacterium]|nr:MAG: hypothetical protein EAZ85_01960 [Bacteroidota bacterium]